LKLKVSGQFKSEQGAIDYANLRSFEALRDVIYGVSGYEKTIKYKFSKSLYRDL
jgi:hypothetical protein